MVWYFFNGGSFLFVFLVCLFVLHYYLNFQVVYFLLLYTLTCNVSQTWWSSNIKLWVSQGTSLHWMMTHSPKHWIISVITHHDCYLCQLTPAVDFNHQAILLSWGQGIQYFRNSLIFYVNRKYVCLLFHLKHRF